MLKITDQDGKVRYVLREEDEEPKDVDEIVLNDDSDQKEEVEEEVEAESEGEEDATQS